MIGCFITRGLVLVLGYAYPAYECFKTVEMNKPDIEQLRFWCQYWILAAGLTVCERIGDMFIGWVPMYSEAKLAFFIYLWYPKTKGTRYVYDSLFRPYVAKHETEIDRNLFELRTRAGDIAFLYWQKIASYGQSRIFEILQYVASQSTPRPSQTQQQSAKLHHPTTPNRRSASTSQQQNNEPPSPTSSTPSSQLQEDVVEEAGPSVASKGAPPTTSLNGPKTSSTQASREAPLTTISLEGPKKSTQPLVKTSKSLNSSEEKVMLIDSVPPASENVQAPPQETIIEESRRTIGARLRKTRTR